MDSRKQALVAQAEEQHKHHPQYKGHWDRDNWVVATAKKDVIHPKRSGIQVLKKGEPVLLNKRSFHTLTAQETSRKSNIGKIFVTVYLPKNLGGVDTVLRVDLFKIG